MASRYVVPFGNSPFGGRDPFRSLQREMSRMLDDTFRSMGESANAWGGAGVVPAIDVHESESELCITADLPGVNESDIDLRVEGDLLAIHGEKSQAREQDERGYHVIERSAGAFQRTVRLPFAPDPMKVAADYANGVLTVRVSKQDLQERSRKIEVGKGAGERRGQQPGLQAKPATNDLSEPPRQQAASESGTRQQNGETERKGRQQG